jgi:hypothetical protein
MSCALAASAASVISAVVVRSYMRPCDNAPLTPRAIDGASILLIRCDRRVAVSSARARGAFAAVTRRCSGSWLELAPFELTPGDTHNHDSRKP